MSRGQHFKHKTKSNEKNQSNVQSKHPKRIETDINFEQNQKIENKDINN
ncbi:hypothetical protein LC087_06040 [Bacillus carboniphilus]|uniref:Uncharacterized protein n=1 Tax=Bacillus carboniphilus TaxID=86663 RepID=A0ABY9JYS2_9BACI|nr:hypothetical protein [Bacillus carboniphilus]WLR43697.1 hypothetical protein LC087_06040 [Bacillus carboniphilus]